jgi:metallo-beta-lactamase family protein
MKLQFLGADRQVTGSRHYLEAGGARVLVDCGMFQERDYADRNWEPCPVPARKLDAVLLTHAHVDHCGLLPKLVREGFRGPILSTPATVELAEVILRDAAHIQEEDALYKAKRHRKEGRRGPHPVVPLFTEEDVERVVPRLQSVPYGDQVNVAGGLCAVFHDAGHILGSAMIELNASGDGRSRRFVFSGDIGQWDRPILRDPSLLAEADFIVMESTYGDRDHRQNDGVQARLAEVIRRTVEAGGNLVIPVFAVERAQELVYHFSALLRRGEIPRLDVFLNSPMAVGVTNIFRRHRECFDEETRNLIGSGESPLGFPGLKLVESIEESKAIQDHPRPAIIMATSGMCTAGRIKHHLRQNITRPESTILFVGYQARGTLGRKILDGDPQVRIHGQFYPVRARIEQIDGFSGHADHSGLVRWIGGFQKPPERLFLVHGEEQASAFLAEQVRRQRSWEVSVPAYRETVGV